MSNEESTSNSNYEFDELIAKISELENALEIFRTFLKNALNGGGVGTPNLNVAPAPSSKVSQEIVAILQRSPGKKFPTINISTQSARRIEELFFSIMNHPIEFDRMQILLLRMLFERKQDTPLLTISECARLSSYSESSLYGALLQIWRRLLFAKMQIKKVQVDDTNIYNYSFWFVEQNIKTIDIDPETRQEIENLVTEISKKIGYAEDLDLRNIDPLIIRGIAFILKQRSLGRKKIFLTEIVSALELPGSIFIKNFPELLAKQLAEFFPEKWNVSVNSQQNLLEIL